MKVLIPNQLQAYTGGKSLVYAEGNTLAAILDDLDSQFPGIKFRAVDEQDRIRKHIRMFVGGRLADTINVTVSTSDEIQIVGALSGG